MGAGSRNLVLSTATLRVCSLALGAHVSQLWWLQGAQCVALCRMWPGRRKNWGRCGNVTTLKGLAAWGAPVQTKTKVKQFYLPVASKGGGGFIVKALPFPREI